MRLFRIRGIQLAVHFSFFLLLAYVAYAGWLDEGMAGLVSGVVILVAFFGCVVLHELGHSFMAMHYGVGVRRILLMPIGGMAEFDSIPREPRKELLITLAGPAVNFAIAAILWLFAGFSERGLFTEIYPASAKGLGQLLLNWNVIMGLFNLVPVFPMDGGRIFRAILATKLTYLRATSWAATVGKVLAVAGIFYMAFWKDSLLGMLLFAFILMAGDAEYRAVKRRELEDAHWRAMLERLYGRPQQEPPVIDV